MSSRGVFLLLSPAAHPEARRAEGSHEIPRPLYRTVQGPRDEVSGNFSPTPQNL